MKSIFKFWNNFWFSNAELLPVSLFRIFFGTLLCVMFIAYLPNWERFYDVNGIVSLNDKSIPHIYNYLSVFNLTDGKMPVILYWFIAFISSIAFAVGYKTRIFTVVLYILYTSMVNRNHFIVYGEDNIIRMLLFYSCFAPLGYRLSIDSFFNKELKNKKFEVWSIRLMQVNIALIYLISTPYKLLYDPSWVNGTAIYWTVMSNNWSRFPYPELFYKWNAFLSKLVSYSALAVEFSFPIFAWFNKTKLFVIAFISMLHLGIAILIPNVTFFTLCMVCSFWVFVPERIVQTLFKRRINPN